MQKSTSQGVRDLNGPRLNGSGYNGHKSASCAHHRSPAAVPTHLIEKSVPADLNGVIFARTARMTCCSLCGAELYENVG